MNMQSIYGNRDFWKLFPSGTQDAWLASRKFSAAFINSRNQITFSMVSITKMIFSASFKRAVLKARYGRNLFIISYLF